MMRQNAEGSHETSEQSSSHKMTIDNAFDKSQVLRVLKSYAPALDLLDDYDHQCLCKPKGERSIHVLAHEECRHVIDSMRFGDESDLFGAEKDDSFKGSIGNIYQSFGGQEIYPSLQEKAANLLYFIIKNHSFLDGNKRIAAALFLYFLDRNDALFTEYGPGIDNAALAAMTIMIAESRPDEKDTMVALVMNFLKIAGRR